MLYNVLIGGAAGQGIDTLADMLQKVIKRRGLYVFTIKDYMSRVRGGHNFIQIRFGDEEVYSHAELVDVMIALNEETIELHQLRMNEDGIIICNEDTHIQNEKLIKIPLTKMAKELENSKVLGSIALGAVLKTFDIDTKEIRNILKETFKREKIIDVNEKAIQKGFELVNKKYSLSHSLEDNNILINGNEAIALGALASGLKFYSAYPMSPSTSIMNYLASKMDELQIIVEQAEDEIAAINMAIGASYAGARAMTGTSGGGFALMVEGLSLAGMTETPLVIAEIQRPGPATGLPTRTEQGDLKFVLSAGHGEFPCFVMAPKNPKDAFYQTIRSFHLADKYQIPVIILGDQFLADSTITIEPFNFEDIKMNRYLSNDLYNNDIQYKRYEITENGVSPRIIPGKTPGTRVLADSDEHNEFGEIIESSEERIKMSQKRLRKLVFMKEDVIEPEFIGDEGFDTLLLGWGSTYGPIKEAIKILNNSQKMHYAALIFGDIWPLPEKKLIEKAQKAERIINVEQNATGQFASVIRDVTGIKCSDNILRFDGRPMNGTYIVDALNKEDNRI